MNQDSEAPLPGGPLFVYQSEDGKLKIDVRFEGETVWLPQQKISLHLQNVYAEGELQLEATEKESLSVR